MLVVKFRWTLFIFGLQLQYESFLLPIDFSHANDWFIEILQLTVIYPFETIIMRYLINSYQWSHISFYSSLLTYHSFWERRENWSQIFPCSFIFQWEFKEWPVWPWISGLPHHGSFIITSQQFVDCRQHNQKQGNWLMVQYFLPPLIGVVNTFFLTIATSTSCVKFSCSS